MFVAFILSIMSLSYSYEVGDKITLGHQFAEHEICYGSNLDLNNDGVLQIAELNGDLNGGHYYVTVLEMSASW